MNTDLINEMIEIDDDILELLELPDMEDVYSMDYEYPNSELDLVDESISELIRQIV